jgi:hypothetical protein
MRYIAYVRDTGQIRMKMTFAHVGRLEKNDAPVRYTQTSLALREVPHVLSVYSGPSKRAGSVVLSTSATSQARPELAGEWLWAYPRGVGLVCGRHAHGFASVL